ncbi:MAG TPA: ParB/RepB/Spo0J family partition protein [Clostridiaceae bacterium]|jgi:ParB family chromosome partitioning protein|nr:ParB/RepB/Spo0J family partition protein [Clostridiaceae bacterium]
MNGKKRLGRGLEALISIEEDKEDSIKDIKINDIEPNKKQPRKTFDDSKLNELAKSIKKHGIVQPIIVKKEDDIYRIIAGERRWRAAKIAGLQTVPAILKELDDREIVEVALIENLQREDLNPIEEAEAYEKLIKEFEMTQEEISEIVGKSRPAIANSLRLLSLSDEVRKMLIDGEITSGHGRTLLMIEDSELQEGIANEIVKNKYSVRETEKLIKRLKETKLKETDERKKEKDPEIKNLEESLQRILGTKVRLNHSKKNGKIIIEYYSKEELERIIEMIKRVG